MIDSVESKRGHVGIALIIGTIGWALVWGIGMGHRYGGGAFVGKQRCRTGHADLQSAHYMVILRYGSGIVVLVTFMITVRKIMYLVGTKIHLTHVWIKIIKRAFF